MSKLNDRESPSGSGRRAKTRRVESSTVPSPSSRSRSAVASLRYPLESVAADAQAIASVLPEVEIAPVARESALLASNMRVLLDVDGKSLFREYQKVIVLRTPLLLFLANYVGDSASYSMIYFLCREMNPAHEAICLGHGRTFPGRTDFLFPDIVLKGKRLVSSFALPDETFPDFVFDKKVYEKRLSHNWTVGSRGLFTLTDDRGMVSKQKVTILQIAEPIYSWRDDPFHSFQMLSDGETDPFWSGPHEIDPLN